MNPQSEFRNPNLEPPAPGSMPPAPCSSPGRGRPRALDDAKRREICALVAGGCAVRDAARYVRCSARTIRREAERDPDFHQQLRRSEMYAQLSPLRSMQQAVATHWRAAAWMLERAYPDRFARRDPAAFAPKQARRLLGEVLSIISSEVPDVFQYERIEKRLRPTFEYIIRDACDGRRTSRGLRRAMRFFEQKERHNNDPFAQLGFPMPNLAPPHDVKVGRASDKVGRGPMEVDRGSPDPAPAPDTTAGRRGASAPGNPSDPDSAPAKFVDFAAFLREIKARNKSNNLPPDVS